MKYEKKDEKEMGERLVGDFCGREKGRKGRLAKQGMRKRGVDVGNSKTVTVGVLKKVHVLGATVNAVVKKAFSV